MNTLSWLVVLLAFSTGGMYSVADTNPSPEKVEVERIRASLDRFTNILSSLAPMRAVQPSLIGASPNFVGVNYCWSFDNGGPDLYRRVEQVIENFSGQIAFQSPIQSKKGRASAHWWMAATFTAQLRIRRPQQFSRKLQVASTR